MTKRYTLIHPSIGRDEIAAVESLLADPEAVPNIAYMSVPGGPIDRLTKEFSAFIAESANPGDPFLQKYAKDAGIGDLRIMSAGFANATGALASLFMANDLAGGEVITTSLNYAGVVNAISLVGGTPKFVDVDTETFCMDPASLEKSVSKDTRAIVLTHMNRFVDPEPIYDVMKSKGLEIPLIQDASLAVGSTLRGLHPGLINIGKGGATVFSLATSKTISGLGGALITCNDEGILRRAISTAYQGVKLESADVLDNRGANFKMNDINAVIAMAQLERRVELFERRRKLAALYDELLSDAADGERLVIQDSGDEAVLTHYAILVNGRTELAKRLGDKHGIPIGMWHIHHKQKPYAELAGKLPVTDSFEDRIAFLPFHTELSDDDVRSICKAFLDEIR